MKKFTIPIYDCVVEAFFEKKQKEADIKIAKFLKDKVDTAPCIASVQRNYQRIAVWIGPKAKEDTVIHECHHLLCSVYEYCSVDLGADEEADAHLMGFISGKILKIWRASKSLDT